MDAIVTGLWLVDDWKNSNARHFRQLARSFSTNLSMLNALNIEILRKDNTKTIQRNTQHRGCMKCYYFWVPYNSCRFSLSVVMFMILLCLLYVFNSIFVYLSFALCVDMCRCKKNLCFFVHSLRDSVCKRPKRIGWFSCLANIDKTFYSLVSSLILVSVSQQFAIDDVKVYICSKKQHTKPRKSENLFAAI